jgi:predicted amidohydrolase YtcJ
VVELIVEDAVIVTMAPGAGPADGMLIRDGRIAAVGQAATVQAAAPGAEVVRLGGATVIPGLIDAHCHVADIGYLAAAADCGQPSAPDIATVQARLRQAAERTPDGSWVTGAGTRSTSSARTGTPPGRTWTRPYPAGPRSCTTRPCTPAC